MGHDREYGTSVAKYWNCSLFAALLEVKLLGLAGIEDLPATLRSLTTLNGLTSSRLEGGGIGQTQPAFVAFSMAAVFDELTVKIPCSRVNSKIAVEVQAFTEHEVLSVLHYITANME